MPTISAWLTLPCPAAAELLSRQGFDALVLDLQHGLIEYPDALAILQAMPGGGATPLVRVAGHDPAMIMKLLDAGALGVICPLISTWEECERFVAACRYPPRGTRSFGPLRAALVHGPDYFQRADELIQTWAMLETREGLDNLEAILAVDGLSGVFIGPNDLCLALGQPPASEPTALEVAAAIQRILAAAHRHGRLAGIFCSGPQAARLRLDEGFDLVVAGSDVGLLGQAAQEALSTVRGPSA